MKKIIQFIKNYPKTGAYLLTILICIITYFTLPRDMKFYGGICFSLAVMFAIYMFLIARISSRQEYWESYVSTLQNMINSFLDEEDFVCKEHQKAYFKLSSHEKEIYKWLLFKIIDQRVKERKFGDGPFKSSTTFTDWKSKLCLIELDNMFYNVYH